jgi:IS30 family transposase
LWTSWLSAQAGATTSCSTPQKKAQSRISEKIWYVVNWSPEQISGWLAANRNLQINHERIDQHVAHDKQQGGSLYLHEVISK